MKLDLVCPHCGAEMSGDLSPGELVQCPACGRTFAAPPPPVAIVKPPRKRRGCLRAFLVLLAVFVIGPILLATCAKERPAPPSPPARPASRPRPSATTTTRAPAPKPSPWKVGSYYDDDGKSRKRVVCESATLGGRVEVTGGAACLVWTIVPTYPLPRVKQGVEWPLGVGRAPGGKVADLVELRRERWIIQGGRVLVLELVDDKGETDLARGVALARAILALPEDDAACFPYPTSDGKSWGLVLPLRGFRSALAELAPGI